MSNIETGGSRHSDPANTTGPKSIVEKVDRRLEESIGKVNEQGDVWDGERWVSQRPRKRS